MSFTELLNTHGVPYAEQGDSHYVDGWLNVSCPFCNDSEKFHLGFDYGTGKCNCFKCGPQYLDNTISKLLDVSKSQSNIFIKQYNILSNRRATNHARTKNKGVYKVELPTNLINLNFAQMSYLKNRGLAVKHIQSVFKAGGTSVFTKLGKSLFLPYRIFIPIYWNEVLVSFQTRAYAKIDPKLKYITCPTDNEVKHHKHILYGRPFKLGFVFKNVLLVEGVMDVWIFTRIIKPPNAVFCTFGITYTEEQSRLMKDIFRRANIFILFDTEKRAQRQAKKLNSELCFSGLNSFVANISEHIETKADDPGDLSQKEAKKLIKSIGF